MLMSLEPFIMLTAYLSEIVQTLVFNHRLDVCSRLFVPM